MASTPDLLGSELVENLLGSVCLLLRAKSREVVKSAMGFVKVIIGVLHPADLAPHLKDLVSIKMMINIHVCYMTVFRIHA